jgi:hypothetical protein
MIRVETILQELASPSMSVVEGALQDLDALVGGASVVASDDQHAIEDALVSFIDTDPCRQHAATAIWLLGKLHDPTVEPYLAELLVRYVDDPECSNHLHQTAIALDSLDVFPGQGFSSRDEDLPRLRELARTYTRRRHPAG